MNFLWTIKKQVDIRLGSERWWNNLIGLSWYLWSRWNQAAGGKKYCEYLYFFQNQCCIILSSWFAIDLFIQFKLSISKIIAFREKHPQLRRSQSHSNDYSKSTIQTLRSCCITILLRNGKWYQFYHMFIICIIFSHLQGAPVSYHIKLGAVFVSIFFPDILHRKIVQNLSPTWFYFSWTLTLLSDIDIVLLTSSFRHGSY